MTTLAQAAAGLSGGISPGLKNLLLQRVVIAVRSSIDRETPVKTGHLKAQTQHQVVGSDYARISNAASYALFVHDPTRAHVIEAKHAKVLRFEVGGKVVFAKRVHHPGTKGDPFFDRGLAQAMPLIDQILDAWGAELLSQLVRS